MSNEENDSLKEKTLQSDLVYRGRFLRIIRDRVLLPDGKEAFREYLPHPGATCVVPVLDDGRFVMVEQYRHSMKQVYLEFPAGKLDKGEDPLNCAARELMEETGFTAKNMSFMAEIHPVIGYSSERILLYAAHNLTEGQQQLDEGEHLRVIYLSPEEIDERLRSGNLPDVKSQAAYFWWKMLFAK